MATRRVVAQNLLLSLVSVALGLVVAWSLWLLYGQFLHFVGAPLPSGLTSWSGPGGSLAMLMAASSLPGFLGAGATLGLVAGQVQFWAWFTLERDQRR